MLSIANRSYMCSTLILGDITCRDFKTFVKNLHNSVSLANSRESKVAGWTPIKSLPLRQDHYGRDVFEAINQQRHVLDNHDVSDYGFIMAATVHSEASDNMRAFNFTHVERERNSKNVTTCDLWVMTIPEFLAELSKYDTDGTLKKELEITCVASAA